MAAIYWISLCLALGLTAITQVVLKVGANRNGSIVNWVTATGLALFGLVTLLSVFSLQGLEMKTVIAWNSLTFIGTPIAANYFLDEPLTKRNLIGAIIICLGVVVFSLG